MALCKNGIREALSYTLIAFVKCLYTYEYIFVWSEFSSLFCAMDLSELTNWILEMHFRFYECESKGVRVRVRVWHNLIVARSNTMPFKSMFHFVAFVVCILCVLLLLAFAFYYDVSSVSFDKQLTWIKNWILLLYKFVSMINALTYKHTHTHARSFVVFFSY